MAPATILLFLVLLESAKGTSVPILSLMKSKIPAKRPTIVDLGKIQIERKSGRGEGKCVEVFFNFESLGWSANHDYAEDRAPLRDVIFSVVVENNSTAEVLRY
ncbi:MAG: hypothetical protein C5B49_00770 [Bdellovibrio sp.]|nr:MAG: hypothetical protein C5B49_00770 [Bdellovibrio sp.]